MGRVLGIDLGRRRVGVAVSDELGILAVPLTTLTDERTTSDRVRRVIRLAREHGVDRFVVGMPLRMDGSEGPEAVAARAFADRLRDRSARPVDLVDERLSTVEAGRRLQEAGARNRHEKIDQASAVVILQSWLDGQKSTL